MNDKNVVLIEKRKGTLEGTKLEVNIYSFGEPVAFIKSTGKGIENESAKKSRYKLTLFRTRLL